MVPQIMTISINCQAIQLQTTEKNGLSEKWTELQTTGRSTKSQFDLKFSFLKRNQFSLVVTIAFWRVRPINSRKIRNCNCLNKEVIIMVDFNINCLSNATNLNVKIAFNNLGLT